MRPLTSDQVRWLRVRAQGLAGDGTAATTVADATRTAAALQAQATGPAREQVWSRSQGLSAADVDTAIAEAAVVRSWLMRGTLHFVAAEDFRSMLAVLGPRNLRNGQRRRDQLGLTDALCERAMTALPEILGGDKALVRAEIVARLAEHGVVLDLKTQQPPHLLAYAANSGLICRGPDLAGEPTYVLIDEWLGPGPGASGDRDGQHGHDRHYRHDREAGLALLAQRYFAAYGPATFPDFAVWAGLTAADANQAHDLIRDSLEEAVHDGARLLLPRDAPEPAPPERPHRLLARFDPYLLGHRSRDLILDPAFAKRVNAGGGMIARTMLAAGRVVGIWSGTGLEPFGDVSAAEREAWSREMRELSLFLG